MKTHIKPLNGFLSLVAIGAISLATITITDNDKAKAEVKQTQGFYLFVESKPIKEFEYLGTIKIRGVVMSNKFETVKQSLINRAKKEYPKADGLIFSEDTFEADAIKFK